MLLEFDSSFITDLQELALNEPMVTGKSLFTFYSLGDEKFADVLSYDQLMKIAKPKDFEANFRLIGTTEYRIEQRVHIFSIGAHFGDISTSLFYQWEIYFKAANYQWDDYISVAEWKQRKISPD